MAKGNFGAAAMRFKAANAYAPKWGRLHMKWGEAIAKLGLPNEAQKEFALAATLDLSAADKAELAKLGTLAEQEETAPGVPQPPMNDEAGATAKAVALGAAGTAAAEAFLLNSRALAEKQMQMLDLQMENLHEERELQHRHLALRYFGDRLRIGLQLVGLTFSAGVLIALGVFLWQAHEDHSVVVEAFDVPPDLAARGITGKVLAMEMLDKLSALDKSSASVRAASTYANNWSSIKVDIPDTGISVGDLNDVLRDWLGHRTHVTGELVRNASGLSLTARAGSSGATTAGGTDAEIDSLVQKAAEAIFTATQPYRSANLLIRSNPAQAAIDLRDLAQHGSAEDRPWAYVGLGNIARAAGDGRGSLEEFARRGRARAAGFPFPP